jgi:hypothetical protein
VDGSGRCEILGQADKWRSTAVYGLAHFGKSLLWYSSEILFAYSLTKYVRLSAPRMGVVLAAGFLVSALLDVVIGAGLQRQLASARIGEPDPTGRLAALLYGAGAGIPRGIAAGGGTLSLRDRSQHRIPYRFRVL